MNYSYFVGQFSYIKVPVSPLNRGKEHLNTSSSYSYFMVKDKVAISLDEGLLHQIDSKVDGNIIRSRSQAIEFYLRKGLREGSVTTVVLLLKGEYQHLAIKEIHGVSLIKKQIEFFVKHGIKRIFLVTQHGRDMGQ